jgi:membrane-bound lytic murein transglycosylase A
MNEYKISNISEKGIRSFFEKRPDLISTILPANPSYSFFKPRNTPPKGAGHVPLEKGISIAVDRRYIPLGATAIASIPRYDETSALIGHELKILLAQDVGGAIKGAGHIDLYMGDESDAREEASQYYHYGKLWLLMPKKSLPNVPATVSLSKDISI